MLELLYTISDFSKNMFRQILQLRGSIRIDIRQVVEQHYESSFIILFAIPSNSSGNYLDILNNRNKSKYSHVYWIDYACRYRRKQRCYIN